MNCYISAIGYYKGQRINQPIASKDRDFVVDPAHNYDRQGHIGGKLKVTRQNFMANS